MANLLYRLGGGIHRFRMLVVLAWVAGLIATALIAGVVSKPMSNSFSIPGQESTEASEILQERLGAGSDELAQASVVVSADSGDLLAPENAVQIAELLEDLRGVEGMEQVSDPLEAGGAALSADSSTGVSSVMFDVIPLELSSESKDGLKEAAEQARGNGLTVEMTGTALLDVEGTGHGAELVGMVVAFIVLAITFGALFVAGMNLLTALIGVGVGLMGITASTAFLELQSTAPTLALMLGVAVGVDYALFVISRFRAELRSGSSVRSAVAVAVATAGSSVVVAGLTVIIALCGLSVIGIPFLAQMGLAAAFVVAVAVLVTLTLTPAVLSFIGHRALPRRQREALSAGNTLTVTPNVQSGYASESLSAEAVSVKSKDRGFFRGWIELIVRRPAITLGAAVIALLVLSAPALSLQTSLIIPPGPNTTSERAEQLLSDSYGPGYTGQVTVLFDGQEAMSQSEQLTAAFATVDRIETVSPAVPTPDGGASIVTIMPQNGPTDTSTEGLIEDLRDTIDGAPSADSIYITGSTAVNIDVASAISDAIPIYLALVVGLAFVLLVMVFRSLLVPLIGVIGFLLSIGASLGLTVAVFQWGWLSELFDIELTGPIVSLTPILMVAILFGLAMDYQIFIVSRIHEDHDRVYTPNRAIIRGFRHAAPVVVAAALIMFAVFAGFFPGGDETLKAISFALSVGILVDAFVVRMLIVPAAMVLMGDTAWILPRWLQWLPRIDAEGATLTTATSRTSPTDAAPPATIE